MGYASWSRTGLWQLRNPRGRLGWCWHFQHDRWRQPFSHEQKRHREHPGTFPLSGIKFVEIAGIGAAPPVLAPLAAMGMADEI